MSASIIQFQAMRSPSASDDESELGYERFAEITREDNTDASANSYQEGWIISYIDILTLLLTLFVILLAMSHFKPDTSSLHQFDGNLSKPEKQNSQSAQGSINNTLASPMDVIVAEQNPDKPQQGASSIVIQEQQPVITYEPEVQSTAANAEHHNVNAQNITVPDTIPTELNALQQNPDTVAINEYLYIDATKMLDKEIDIARILPVQSALTETSDEMMAYEQKNNALDSNVAFAENHQQNMTPLSHVRNELMTQIENSELGNLIEISEVQNHVNLAISDDVLFAPGSVDLKPEGLELLEQLAGMIKATKLNISVEGHTDNVPINNTHFPSNWELSTARATMVTRHLIENDITPSRIRAIGYADTHPRANNETVQGRERNRRVSIILHMPGPATQMDALATISH